MMSYCTLSTHPPHSVAVNKRYCFCCIVFIIIDLFLLPVMQYSHLVSLCNDLVHTLCSAQRVASLQQDAATATPDALLRVEAWSRALSSALDKLNSEEFSVLTDVLQPFSVGIQQVKDARVCLHVFVCTI